MPYRQKRRRGSRLGAIVNSSKNFQAFNIGLSGTITNTSIAVAVDAASNINPTEVTRNSLIKAIYVWVDVCGLAGTGVLNAADFYMMKNPGANLTPPLPITYGSSNEKKFIFKTWSFMIMRNQEGNAPFHWEGWVKIPKRYQRMGANDLIQICSQSTATITGHMTLRVLYKWYS